jgi:hypothetical protein
MTSILRAITWEFWRENRWWIIVSVCAIAGSGSLVYGDPYYQYDHENILHLTAFFIETSVFAIFLCHPYYNKKKSRLGFPEHLFIRPVRMRSVALIRVGLAVVTAVSLYLLTAGIFNLATQISWPVLLPCLYIAASVVLLHAIAWSLPAVPALQIVLSTIGLYVLCLLFFYHEQASGTLGLLVFIVVGSSLALAGAALDRRSQRVKLTTLWSRIIWVVTACLPWKNCTHVSPQRALFWFQWIRKGWIMPAISVTLIILGYILSCAVPWTKPSEFIMIYYTLVLLLHFVGFPAVVSFIICQQETQNQGLPTYTSSLPVTNRELLLAYLKASLASLFISWAVFAIGLCLLQLLLMAAGKGHLTEAFFSNLREMARVYRPLSENAVPWQNVFQIQVAFCLIPWAALGLIGSMLLSGRRSVGVTAMAIIFTWPTIPALAQALGAPEPILIALVTLEAILFIMCIIGGTVVAYVYGTLKKRIHPYLTVIALLMYIALNLFYAQAIWRNPREFLESLVLLAVVALPLTPFATAPLALAWNRHR